MAFNAAARAKKEEEELIQMMKEAEKASKQTEEDDSDDDDKSVSTPVEEKPKKDDDKTPKDNWEKRYGDLRRYSQQKDSEHAEKVKELKEQLKEAKTHSFKESLPATESELEEWQAENPHAAALVETLASRIAENKFQSYRDELDEIRSTVVSDRAQVDRDRAEAKILKAHPDFDELKEDSGFLDWVDDQVKSVQNAVYDSSDADEVIWAINMYKAIGQKPKRKQKQDTSAAEEIKAKAQPNVDAESSKGKIKESEIEAMSEKEFMDREEEILAAQRSGNIIWDLSGAAS